MLQQIGIVRRRNDLPFEQDQSTRFLPWIIAPMVFLGVMALAAVELVGTVAASWQGAVAGSMTVQIPPAADEPMTERVERALAFAIATPEVERAAALEMDAARALLAPWLGEATDELPVPALIEIELVRGAALDAELFAARLADIVDGAVVDDHRVWLQGLIDLADLVRAISLGALTLVALSAVAAVVYATRSGLAVHGRIIELLHHMGAHDDYIARQFQSHVTRLSVRGGVLGASLAAACLAALFYAGRGLDATFFPPLSLSPGQWGVLAAVPVLLVLVARLTARLTVLRSLARMP